VYFKQLVGGDDLILLYDEETSIHEHRLYNY
jgi:hypothetical protein